MVSPFVLSISALLFYYHNLYYHVCVCNINCIQPFLHPLQPASSVAVVKDPNYKPCYVAGTSGLPSLDNIPSVADLTASFAARKEERIKQEAEKKDMERRVSVKLVEYSGTASTHT